MVKLLVQPWLSLSTKSRMLGIERSMLKRWVENFPAGKLDEDAKLPLKFAQRQENEQPRRELAKVKSEYGIPKNKRSPNSGKRSPVLEDKAGIVAEAMGHPYHHPELVLDALAQLDAERPSAMSQDPGQARFRATGERLQRFDATAHRRAIPLCPRRAVHSRRADNRRASSDCPRSTSTVNNAQLAANSSSRRARSYGP
jgi:hypothetical protein